MRLRYPGKICLSIFFIMAALILTITCSAQAVPSVIIDNQALQTDSPPVIENGRTLVPLRGIFEALGAAVTWTPSTQTVTAKKADVELKLMIGGQAYKNNEPVALDAPAKLIAGRTFVPLRFVSDAFGAKIAWDSVNQTITVTSKPKDLIITDEKATYPISGITRLRATLENPNDTQFPYQCEYRFLCYDRDGKLLDSIFAENKARYTLPILPPHQKVTIFAPSGYGNSISSVKLDITRYNWETYTPAMPQFKLISSYNVTTDSFTQFSGTISHSQPTYLDAWVIVYCYDANNNLIDAGNVIVNDIAPDTPAPFTTSVAGRDNDRRISTYKIVILPANLPGFGY